MSKNSDFLSENSIEVVIAIPSYNETATLPILIKELSPFMEASDAILILDDSELEIYNEIKLLTQKSFNNSKGSLFFSNHNGKSGRGLAIRRGMAISRKQFPKLKYFIECDADGSHQVSDILKIKNYEMSCDLLVGSRYLAESTIIGWSNKRKFFSKILNFIIPFILNIPITDITNGLRRYTSSSVEQILATEQINKGFIYLSEQVFILHINKFKITEIPITFIERILGNSTVTWREIVDSLKGIFYLFILKKKMNV